MTAGTPGVLQVVGVILSAIGPGGLLLLVLLGLGPTGLIIVVWYVDKRQTDAIMRQYREDMIEQRRMYENNVELVRRYDEVASDLKEIIILNSTAMQKLVDRIDKEVC